MPDVTKGAIKLKNVNEELVSFLPKTNSSCVSDASGKNLDTIISEIESGIIEAENSGGVEIIHSELDNEQAEGYSNETLIAWYKNPELDGTKHLSVKILNNSERTVLKVGDTVQFTYAATNDGGE